MNDRPHGNQKSLAAYDAFVTECLRFLDHEMSTDEVAAFQQRLEADERLQVDFVRLMIECEMLVEACDAQRTDDIVKMAGVYARSQFLVGGSVKESAHLFQPREVLSLAGYMVWQGLRAKAGVIGSLAAVVLIGAALYLSIFGSGRPPAPQNIADNTPTKPADSAKPTPPESERHAVATLTNTHNATWAEGALAPGTELTPNQRLTLTAGFAEITTASGAVAILEAPATVELLDNNNAIRLHTGKLVGICETERSQGFTVFTEHARIVDLGTVFGVEHKDGHTFTTVFDGEIAVSASEADQAQPVYLTPGQSARVDAQAHVQRIAATPQSQFVRQWQAVAQPPYVTGQIEYQPALPASLAPNVTESNQIQLYPEARGVQLDRDFRATLTEPGRHETFFKQGAQPIGPARVDAYLVHYDYKVGNDDPKKPRRATIRFDRPILGVIADGDSLFTSDPFLAMPGVDFGPSGDPQVTLGRGLESKGDSLPDIVEISEDRRTLTLELYSWMAIDQLRILVQSPEPIVQ